MAPRGMRKAQKTGLEKIQRPGAQGPRPV